MNKSKVILIILDGWGIGKEDETNAIHLAKTPNFDNYWSNFPHSQLQASGEAVGLPEGQMGNSEVGHLSIGSGRTIDTDLVKISKAASTGQFSANHAFKSVFEHVKKYDSVLHIQGLIGPGGVHSHSNHLVALLKAAKSAGIEKIAIHAFTDGRDTDAKSANKYLEEIEDAIENIGVGFIATATGRFYAMDRDDNWGRLKIAEDAIFDGIAKTVVRKKPSEIMEELYEAGITDEHIEPHIFLDEKGNGYKIGKNDGIVFINFRSDRAKMFSKHILERQEKMNLFFVTMTDYGKDIDSIVAFPPDSIRETLSEVISEHNLKQSHIAETEKFAHATYFLNGGVEEEHKGEKFILIESRKDIKTHDLAPGMRAKEISDKTIEEIKKNVDFIFVNFANPDMVGHTAVKSATIEAIETTDRGLGKVVEKALEGKYDIIISSDHGNAEAPDTAHTINPVPFIYIGDENKIATNGSLSDIAPTILDLIDIKKPALMTGKVLLK